MPKLIDLAADLHELTRLASETDDLDGLLAHALDALAAVVPYDLAAVHELDGDQLSLRVARGALAHDRLQGHTISLHEHPTVRRSLETRRPVAAEGDPYDGVLDLDCGHACMVVPLFVRDRSLGAITFDRTICETYPPEVMELAGIYGQIVGLAFLLAEQARLLRHERRTLREHTRRLQGASAAAADLVALPSPAMQALVQAARQVAPHSAPVLILGETGVGKEVLAQAIHDWSDRREGPFVKVNCAALPEALLESELFGHLRGAFSGATGDRPGRFATANGGTLLLDEIGELAPNAQAKLLRVLQEGTFEPVGADRAIRVDVRVLAATHVDLRAAVAAGTFREDLYYRLDVFPLTIPPLRERPEDAEVIAGRYLANRAQTTRRGPWHLADPGALRHRPWPGNIRELLNELERATILRPRGPLHITAGPPRPTGRDPTTPTSTPVTLAEVQAAHIRSVLAQTNGRIYGVDGAATLLGLKPSTLQSRMKKLGVVRDSPR